MTKRDDAATVQLKVRMKEHLRADLAAAAESTGTSLNSQAVERLERSFTDEDRFGGPQMVDVVNIMAGAFRLGGQRGAQSRGHPEWSIEEWMQDSFCFRSAVQRVVQALMEFEPAPYESGHPVADQRALHEKIMNAMAGVAAAGGQVQTRMSKDHSKDESDA